MQVTLISVVTHPLLKPMKVETEKDKWPLICPSGENPEKFHGIGELRQRGYDVSTIKTGVVYELD